MGVEHPCAEDEVEEQPQEARLSPQVPSMQQVNRVAFDRDATLVEFVLRRLDLVLVVLEAVEEFQQLLVEGGGSLFVLL